MTAPTIVVGSGPAGAIAAATLANAGRDVVLLHAPRTHLHLGERLPPSARPVLQRLGLWQQFCTGDHRPSPGITSSWGGNELGGRVSMTDAYGPAWLINRTHLERSLLDAALAAGVAVRSGVLAGIYNHTASVGLALRHAGSDTELSADVVVDATGRARRVAHAMGARTVHGDRLVAFSVVLTDDSADQRAHVEAFHDGWWYSAPLYPGRRIIVCFTDPDLPTAAIARQPGGLAELLIASRHLSYLATPASAIETVHCTAAGTSWLTRTSGPRWVAIGDAASAVDPLSGRGLLAAMLGGCRAALSIATNDDAYERWITGSRVHLRGQQIATYRLERRWSDHPFWARRRSALPRASPRSG